MDATSTLELMQQQEFFMLKRFHKICEDNNISYFLACGTALGSRRHKGFIPWDDDVDIYMFPQDYYKLQKIFYNNNDAKIELHDYITKEDYPYPFPKIVLKSSVLVEEGLISSNYKCGIYIDIFILSSLSDNPLISFFQEVRRYYLYAVLRAYYVKMTGWKKLLNYFTRKIIDSNEVKKKLFNLYLNKEYSSSLFVIDTGTFGHQAKLKREYFQGSSDGLFGDSTFPIPVAIDSYLKDYYGNYMEFPPVSERTPKHNIRMLVINDKRII